MKRILTIFLVSIKHRGHEESTKDDNHERRAREESGMKGVGEYRGGEEGNSG